MRVLRTVEVNGEVDDTGMLIFTDNYLPVSLVRYTSRLNCRRTRTVAPVQATATRKMRRNL